MHGKLVQGTHVLIRLLTLHVRLLHYSIATQPADYNDYLISKLSDYYLKKFRDSPIVIK